MPTFWDDRTLVQACLAGDEAAWAELRAIVSRLAAGAVYSYRLASHLIEDCTQVTLEAVVKDDCAALRRMAAGGADADCDALSTRGAPGPDVRHPTPGTSGRTVGSSRWRLSRWVTDAFPTIEGERSRAMATSR